MRHINMGPFLQWDREVLWTWQWHKKLEVTKETGLGGQGWSQAKQCGHPMHLMLPLLPWEMLSAKGDPSRVPGEASMDALLPGGHAHQGLPPPAALSQTLISVRGTGGKGDLGSQSEQVTSQLWSTAAS